jgi:hypothetical protein
MTIRRPWIVLVLVIAVAAFVPAISHAGATATRVSLSFLSGTQCGLDGERIAYKGDMSIVYAFTSPTEGVFQEQQIATAHLVGVGLVSGDKYIFNATGHIFESTSANRGSLVMEADRAVEIHAGESTVLDDFYMRMSFNPGGAYVDESGCR